MAEITIDLNLIRKNGIFLMVPAYGGQCYAAFTRSLMQLSALCTQYQIPFEAFFIYNESLITRARNYCASVFLESKFKWQDENKNIIESYYQHGLFIDADIEFNPMDVLVLAHLQNTNDDYNVVCGVYPKKTISWEKIKQAVEKGFADNNPADLEKYVGDFVFNSIDEKPIRIDTPAPVSESGTGFMMFRRDTLLKVDEHFPNIRYRPDHARSNFDGSKEISAYFDTSIDPKTKRYLSEDYHFCKLVREAGMNVYIVPWFELKHHGYFVFGGSLPAMAEAGVAATVDVTKIKKK